MIKRIIHCVQIVFGIGGVDVYTGPVRFYPNTIAYGRDHQEYLCSDYDAIVNAINPSCVNFENGRFSRGFNVYSKARSLSDFVPQVI